MQNVLEELKRETVLGEDPLSFLMKQPISQPQKQEAAKKPASSQSASLTNKAVPVMASVSVEPIIASNAQTNGNQQLLESRIKTPILTDYFSDGMKKEKYSHTDYEAKEESNAIIVLA